MRHPLDRGCPAKDGPVSGRMAGWPGVAFTRGRPANPHVKTSQRFPPPGIIAQFCTGPERRRRASRTARRLHRLQRILAATGPLARAIHFALRARALGAIGDLSCDCSTVVDASPSPPNAWRTCPTVTIPTAWCQFPVDAAEADSDSTRMKRVDRPVRIVRFIPPPPPCAVQNRSGNRK